MSAEEREELPEDAAGALPGQPHTQEEEGVRQPCLTGRRWSYQTVLWIRTRMDPHHFGSLDPYTDPHPHLIKIWIRIQIQISWNRIRIRINLQMSNQNVCNMSIFEHFFKGLSPIWNLGPGPRSGPASRWKVRCGSASASNKIPDPHQIKIKFRIRIRFKYSTSAL